VTLGAYGSAVAKERFYRLNFEQMMGMGAGAAAA
jgi:hypothetical protein